MASKIIRNFAKNMKDVQINKVLEKLGIDSLNAMQQEAMECILRGRNDVVVLSPTGTGKTLAYLLPQRAPLCHPDSVFYSDHEDLYIADKSVIPRPLVLFQ